MKTFRYILFFYLGTMLTACRDYFDVPQFHNVPNEITLSCQTEQLLNVYRVTSRGQDEKNETEQAINTLHVFIFDNEGQYLESTSGKDFQAYKHITLAGAPIAIDKNGWLNTEKASHATIVVLANLEPGTFTLNKDQNRPHPQQITEINDLLTFHYHPLKERIVSALPEEGMPMYSLVKDVNLTTTNTEKNINIPMKAMMARIDFNIRLDGKDSDAIRGLPQFTVTQLEVLNVPESTTIQPERNATTNLEAVGKKNHSMPPGTHPMIQHQAGELNYYFYVFENIQLPNTPFEYPEGIDIDERQRYKPLLADPEKAMAYKITGTYLTHNGGTYKVTYTLYLGADHTDDFTVKRNHQYKNNITIRGINLTGNNTGAVTLDTRVNISESNPFYIAMLGERRLDSHFNILPMDIHFFNTHLPSGTYQTMEIEIVDPDTHPWLRMEKIPARDMQNGTLPSISDNGPDLLSTGSFTAGHGKRRFFTTDLVSHTLRDNTHIIADAHRDRVYFYVDENLEVWHLGTNEPRTRNARIRFIYKENNIVKTTHELTFEQANLLEVKFHDNENNDFNGKSFYMEAYEEYTDYKDPLGNYNDGEVYKGLPWGALNSYIGRARCRNANKYGYRWSNGYVNAYDNWYWGWEFTPYIVNKDIPISHINIIDNNHSPHSAAIYCILKNKRRSDGSIGRENMKWYLPGIRELERMLEDYFIEYEEFQNNYYWSSTPGRVYGEDIQHARATKAYQENGIFKYYESSPGHTYTGENGVGGYTPRQDIKLRIRAARIDNLP